jgi:hypothetical protein
MTDDSTTTAGTEPATQDLGEGGKRALDAERRARRDAEKALRETQARVAELERADLVREVASAKGIAPELASRLQGNTREELEADADQLLTIVKPDPERRDGPGGKPQEALRGGGDPTVEPPDPVDKIAEKILDQ